MSVVVSGGVEPGVWILAGATCIAALVGAGGAIWAAVISRENRRKLTTPGTDTGTIGEQVEKLK